MNIISYSNPLINETDGFGEKGKPASAGEGAVPPNATLEINLELVSWNTVSEVTDDNKVMKKILKEGEGYERPNEGAVVKGLHFGFSYTDVFTRLKGFLQGFYLYLSGSEIDRKTSRWNCIPEERSW